MAEIPPSADIVIVGGGAVGASTAYHLAVAGVTNVVLVERGQLAGGSTAKSAGGIRLQFGDELNIRIGARGLDELERWEELIGAHVDFVPDIGFHQTGYLFLLREQHDLATFEAALAVQHRLGVPSRLITPAEAQAIVPQLVVDDLIAATFCPRDGHMSPEAVTQGYAAAAAAMGVRIVQGTDVTGIDVVGARITGVETTAGRIATDTVVCAAGAWSNEVGALAGIDIPVHGMARHMWFSPESGGLPDAMPLTIDFSSGFYSHREGPGIVFGGRESDVEDVAVHALHRLPVIGELPIQSTWWGYYDESPDHNGIVGESAGLSRFLYATGFSGHGFQQAPAVGEHLAELFVGATPTIDMASFTLDRFADGVERTETFIV
jgi:sarcosine oxidase subunit beta